MKIARLMLGAALGAVALGASAANTTTTFQVSASVTSSCSVTATAHAFGSYDPTSAVVAPGLSSVSVTCTLGAPYTIALDAGSTAGGTTAVRKMTDGTNTLNYKLCQDVACVANWGNTVGTDTVAGVGTGLIAAVPVSIFGQIPTGQNVPAGSYLDTVTVTVNY